MEPNAVRNALAILATFTLLAGCGDEIAVNAAADPSQIQSGTQWAAPAAGKTDGEFKAHEYY